MEETSTQDVQADLALPVPRGMTFARPPPLGDAIRGASRRRGRRGARLADHGRVHICRALSQALVWYGIALVLALAFAWDVSVSPPAQWRSRLISFWSRHRIEIILFLLILGFGVFMRLFMY